MISDFLASGKPYAVANTSALAEDVFRKSFPIRALLRAQPEIDSVEALFTMKTGLDSTLVAARVDLVPGLDSEQVEEVAVRIKKSIARTVSEADQVFLDVTDRPAREAAESPAATGEHGGA